MAPGDAFQGSNKARRGCESGDRIQLAASALNVVRQVPFRLSDHFCETAFANVGGDQKGRVMRDNSCVNIQCPQPIGADKSNARGGGAMAGPTGSALLRAGTPTKGENPCFHI